jgi:hypothetical protein
MCWRDRARRSVISAPGVIRHTSQSRGSASDASTEARRAGRALAHEARRGLDIAMSDINVT